MFQRDRRRVQERLDIEFHQKQRERAKRSLLFKDLDGARNEIVEGGTAPRPSLRERLQTLLDQSGLDLSQNRLLSYCTAAGTGTGLLAGIWQRNIFVGLGGLVLGVVVPLWCVRFKRNSRQEALRRQLSDAFDLMARILRAGQSMPQAMQGVATEFQPPIAEEFAFCSEQQMLGLSPEISLRDLARRTGLVETNIFVVAVLVQRQVGGNLAEILEKLAHVVRERYKMRGTIKSLTAEGRMQAGVLMALPPFLFGMMLVVNYDYAHSLIEHSILIWGMLGFMGLGGLWIRKIVNFDF
jgi:tight adherence protein B